MTTQLAVTWWSSLHDADHGERIEMQSWDELYRWLSLVKPRPKNVERPDLPGWSAALFSDDKRSKEAAEVVTAIGLDVDKGGVTLEQVRAALEGWSAIVHSTRRYTPEAPRWRVVIEVSRPFSAARELEGVWSFARDHLARHGITIDEQPKDASRFWFVPCEPQVGEYVIDKVEGKPLDIDAIVQQMTLPVSRPTPVPTSVVRGRGYGGAALDDACRRVASAQNGSRNATLNDQAFSIARLVSGGEVDATLARAELEGAALSAGLPATETRRTIKSAFDAGMKKPRTRPEKRPRAVGTRGGAAIALRVVSDAEADDVQSDAEIDAANEEHRLDEAPAAQEQRELDAWERDLLRRLILDKRLDKQTGEESFVIRPVSANVAAILRHHEEWCGVVALDTFAGRIVTTRPPPWDELDAPTLAKAGPWTDADTARATHWLARTWIANLRPITISTKAVDAAVVVAAEANAVHPVREYLGGLTWDGVARADKLASTYLGGEDTEYSRSVGACFLIGAVARIRRPGSKVDTCPIIEGPQGAKKSTALGILGGEWFTDSKIPIGTKDAFQMIRGVWIAELSELGALSKSDVETTKAFMSSRVDRYRPSYGRHDVEVPRQTVFVGTTNESSYLKDATGARRFPPLRTGTIDLAALERDRDQLWAEARHRFEAGEPWWLSGELVGKAAEETEERFIRDPWEASIAAYLAGDPCRADTGVTTEELLAACGREAGQRTRGDAMRIGECLARLGWARRRVQVEKARTYRYYPKEST